MDSEMEINLYFQGSRFSFKNFYRFTNQWIFSGFFPNDLPWKSIDFIGLAWDNIRHFQTMNFPGYCEYSWLKTSGFWFYDSLIYGSLGIKLTTGEIQTFSLNSYIIFFVSTWWISSCQKNYSRWICFHVQIITVECWFVL